jgi:hypothetical protein
MRSFKKGRPLILGRPFFFSFDLFYAMGINLALDDFGVHTTYLWKTT